MPGYPDVSQGKTGELRELLIQSILPESDIIFVAKVGGRGSLDNNDVINLVKCHAFVRKAPKLFFGIKADENIPYGPEDNGKGTKSSFLTALSTAINVRLKGQDYNHIKSNFTKAEWDTVEDEELVFQRSESFDYWVRTSEFIRANNSQTNDRKNPRETA